MFTGNPFAELNEFFPPAAMQGYVVAMAVLVAAGTLADMLHKGSARFFVTQWRQKHAVAPRRLGSIRIVGLALKTLFYEVATSGEFCNLRRRLSHLLLFYGFVIYLVATVVLVFRYPTADTPAPAYWPLLWNLGAVMVLAGGLWFFFYLRVDVAKEGHSPWRLMRADLFIVSLLSTAAFGLLWEIIQATAGRTATWIAFGLYILSATVLFGSVPWSKFAHMFYKPAAALQRRVEEADGSTSLPEPADVSYIER